MPEGAAPEGKGIHHLVGNVWEWVVIAPGDCEEISCHRGRDGEVDVAFMGGAYVSYLDRVTMFVTSDSANPDEFIGFRCVSFKRK
jgi:formylglycine-generating enzyme required for sulfatase activity